MTSTNAPATPTDEQIRTAHRQQEDLRYATERTRKQYDKGMLTLQEFIEQLAVIHNTYFDDPEHGFIAVLIDCDPDD